MAKLMTKLECKIHDKINGLETMMHDNKEATSNEQFMKYIWAKSVKEFLEKEILGYKS